MVVRKNKNGDYKEFFAASKDNCRYSADSPEELLGLIYMHEQRGENWRHMSEDEYEAIEKLDDNSITLDEEGNQIQE